MNDIEKALTYFQGISNGDVASAIRYMDPERYVEHNPQARDGVDGVREYVDRIARDHPDLKVIRAYQDGFYVFTQTDGLVLGDGTFFDVFRFDGGLIVEHWVFSAEAAPPNKSGHTQIDGPTEPKPGENTEKNRTLVRDYYETFHIAGHHDVLQRYFAGDRCVRHEPGVADGVGEFVRDLEVLMPERTINRIGLLLGQGDFVFLVAEGTHLDVQCYYVDLYRAEDGKIVEHWGFPQQLPPMEERTNANAML